MFSSNASAVSGDANYIEDVFSTYLYTGNGSTQTITNGIDLAGKGGLTWIKSRSANTEHFLFDTSRGVLNEMNSNSTAAQASLANSLTAFNANGFALGSAAGINVNAATYASWAFRKQPKFFDVVTYSGNAQVSQVINHNLGSVPGCIIVKAVSGASGTASWNVYHRSVGNTSAMQLNTTDAPTASISYWRNTDPTATQFTVGGVLNDLSTNFVAYLFAHNAGGFGLTGTDNVISCGSYTGNGSATGPVVTLGYEPQFVILKSTVEAENWFMIDTMRGMTVNSDQTLAANASIAEVSGNNPLSPLATGFQITEAGSGYNLSGNTYIYIAIRRGPMKVPTTGTSVFGLNARTGTGGNATVTGSAGVSDAVLIKNRGAAVAPLFSSRLTGTGYLVPSTAAVEVAAGTTILQANPWDVMDGVKVGTTSTITNASANTYINYLFDRAPGFFDVVCYTGTGAAQTLSHNLGAVPEMMLVKERTNDTGSWYVYAASLGATKYVNISGAGSATSSTVWNDTQPTSSAFTVGSLDDVSGSGDTYIAYLFATCPGVSKVGSYTGTGTTLQIDCGFTAGSSFIMIKRTDSTGDWYVWDSARGIIAGNDPYIVLNDSAAEVTGTDYVDTYSAGFEISSTAPVGINASGGTFIFLAIA